MSVSALTTLATVRDTRKPNKRDVGKTTDVADAKDEDASITDVLVTAIPTELVAPYTAVTAAIVGTIGDEPDAAQLTGWRWLAFALLLLGTAATVWSGKRAKSDQGSKFPLLEISTAVVAATGWALALPESPLIPYLGESAKAFVPILIAFAAVVALAPLGANLKKPRRS